MDCHGKWPLSELAPLVADASAAGKPVVFVGSGTERLEQEDSRRIVEAEIAPRVDFWTVRSERDEARLREYGVPHDRVRVAADMAWLLEPASPEWARRQLDAWGIPRHRRLVGVNLVMQQPVGVRYPNLLTSIAAFLDTLIEESDATVLFLSNDVKDARGFDRWSALSTIAAMKHPSRTFLVPNEYWPPWNVMSLIANCAMTLSMRYHFCLFSALQRVPFIALNRSDKVTDLCSDLSWPFCSGLDGLTAEGIVELNARLHTQPAMFIQELDQRVTALRERARHNVVGLTLLDRAV
jgi:polysaccharide pyruvyl transferase WcaK-like protein